MKKKGIIILILAAVMIFCGCKSDADDADEETYYSDASEILNESEFKDKIDEYLARDDVILMFGSTTGRYIFGEEYSADYAELAGRFISDSMEGKPSSLHVVVYLDDTLGNPYGFDGEELILRDVDFDGAEYRFTERCLKSGRERSGAFSRLRTATDVRPAAIDYLGTRAEYCYLTGEEDTSFDEIKQGTAPLYEERDDRFIVFLNYYNTWKSSGVDNILIEPHYFEDIDSSLTAEEALDRVKRRDVVVFEDGKLTAGDLTWSIFYNDSTDSNYLKTEVMIAHYYTLDKDRVSEELYEAEKDNYPQLYLSILEYNRVSEEYTIRTRDYRETDFSESGSYKYLKKFEGDLPSGAVYKHYTEYILVDDDTLTHEEIMKSLYSSNIRENVRSRTVYSDYHD